MQPELFWGNGMNTLYAICLSEHLESNQLPYMLE